MKKREFTINLKETLLRNLFWIILLFVVFYISILSLKMSEYFNGEGMVGFKLMYLVFCLFFVLKLLTWLGQPEVILRYKGK